MLEYRPYVAVLGTIVLFWLLLPVVGAQTPGAGQVLWSHDTGG